MLEQKTGSELDGKTNQDINEEHPNHDASGLIRGSQFGIEKTNKTIIKKTDMNTIKIKRKIQFKKQK